MFLNHRAYIIHKQHDKHDSYPTVGFCRFCRRCPRGRSKHEHSYYIPWHAHHQEFYLPFYIFPISEVHRGYLSAVAVPLTWIDSSSLLAALWYRLFVFNVFAIRVLMCVIRWGCNERLITIPYTASSAVTTPALIGGRPPEERNILFFFVGTARKRPERENLAVSGYERWWCSSL